MEFHSLHKEVKNEIIYQIKYKGYLDRELRNISKLKEIESIKIPKGFLTLTYLVSVKKVLKNFLKFALRI